MKRLGFPTKLLLVAVVVDIALAWAVARGGHSGCLSLAWLLVVCLLVASALLCRLGGGATGGGGTLRARSSTTGGRGRAALLLAGASLLPLGPRVANLSMTLSHPDEFALAWFSHEFDLVRTSLFGPIPETPVWHHQMPALYFALQKLFFLVFGEAPSHVKLSTMPYVVLTAGALFFLSRRLLGTVPGLAAVGIYAILAPSVYADTFGTTISASMAFFMLFFAASVVNLRRQEHGTALLVGVTCAFCTLAAPTSYVAVPLLVAFPVLALRCLPPRTVVRGLGVSLAGFALVLLPFVSGAVQSKNYFAERLVRVAPVVAPLFGATPSPEEVEPPGPGVVAMWKMQTGYLWKDDVGGCCGFGFGRVALLDPVTALLALAGLALGFLREGIRLEWTMAVSVVAASLLALGFANPPPMITRYSLFLPFVALFLAAPVASLLRDGARGAKAVRRLAAALLIAGIVTANVLHLRSALKRDTAGGRGEYEDVKVARYLQKTFPGHDVKVAAFGGFHLGYTLRFFLPGVDVETDYHQQLLDRLKQSRSRDYVFVVLFPEEFNAKFRRVDPTGVVVTGISRTYSLFVSRDLARSAGLVSSGPSSGAAPGAPQIPAKVSSASAASTG